MDNPEKKSLLFTAASMMGKSSRLDLKQDVAKKLRLDQEERLKRPRQLTSHTCCRFYRAPEIILQEPEYDFTMDNWSIGCILGELLNFCEAKNSQNS